MKFLGHPIHIMLIHFPSALFPMDLACAAAGYYTREPAFTTAAFYALCGGVAFGWLAIIFGTFDLLTVYQKKPEAMQKALLHGGINSLVLVVYTVLGFMQWKQYPALHAAGMGMLWGKLALVAVLIVGNYFGGSLILKHKVGVENE